VEFRIADTFTDSLAKLTNDEQKAVKTTAFDLQLNPASPGLQFHKLARVRDPNFWSVRVGLDIRLIVHRSKESLLAPELADVDGNTEQRTGTISVFNGPKPLVKALDDENAETSAVSQWLRARSQEVVTPHERGVFVRSEAQLDRARNAKEYAGLPYKLLDENVEISSGCASISTMHLAKGLEFRAVVVMACDDEIVPLQERIETVSDDTDLEEVYNTERHLLYVACTRARDRLLVTGVEPASEFLDDLLN